MGVDRNSDLVASARSLVPLLREHAAASEAARHPADAVIAGLRDAGIFELMVPGVYGGRELDLDTFLDVGLELAAGDASAAWVTTFYIEHNWMLCQFPEAFQKELFADVTHVLAPASISPDGMARPVDNGFELSGRWRWGTGVWHGEWAIVSAPVVDDADIRDLRLFAVPRVDFELIDTWFVDGLCGTGSHDIEISSVRVPMEQTVLMSEMANGCAPGSRLHDGPLYRTPMLPILGLAASMPAVGLARAGVAQLQAELPERKSALGATPRRERASVQARLARAVIECDGAEWLLRDVVREACRVRERATGEERARWLACTAMAVARSREVLRSLGDVGGASGHFLDHPLQRAIRDVTVMSSHMVFDLDARLENYGRTLLGLPPIPPF